MKKRLPPWCKLVKHTFTNIVNNQGRSYQFWKKDLERDNESSRPCHRTDTRRNKPPKKSNLASGGGSRCQYRIERYD